MKNRIYQVALALLLSLATFNVQAAMPANNDGLKAKAATMTKEAKEARIKEIELRVKEIRDMDKSTLTRAEKTALKHELKDMRKEARVMSGGVYLSVGAIIIIILVLILIL